MNRINEKEMPFFIFWINSFLLNSICKKELNITENNKAKITGEAIFPGSGKNNPVISDKSSRRLKYLEIN